MIAGDRDRSSSLSLGVFHGRQRVGRTATGCQADDHVFPAHLPGRNFANATGTQVFAIFRSVAQRTVTAGD